MLDCLHFRDPASQPLWTAIEHGTARCLADDATLDELGRVLAYRQFGLDADAQQRLYRTYAARIERVAIVDRPPLPRCRDVDDQKFLALAAAGNADLLISKDRDLLRMRRLAGYGFRIVPPGAVDPDFTRPD